MRLDTLLVEKKLVSGRDRAKALVMAGSVYVDNQRALKPGMQVSDENLIEVRENKLPYVSRGGLKLEKAMQAFSIDLTDAVCMDIGASTGGFTDCMLQNGAQKVFAVDVGYGQLAWSLRTDERVEVMERTNIRYVLPEQIGCELDFISIDVSFISLSLVLPVAHSLLREKGHCVCLIKPQFEAGRENVGKKGVVRDAKIHSQVVYKILDLATKIGFSTLALDFSPIRGPEGNIEYLLYIQKSSSPVQLDENRVREIIELSHSELCAKGDNIS